MFDRAYEVGAMSDFQQRVNDNMLRLERETGMSEFAVPVCIFLLLDEANGGNAVSQEIVRRFNLIDAESRNVIDFYFMGWSRAKLAPFALQFDLSAFQACRLALSKAGIESFGGYADLLLFDAWKRSGRVFLDFEHALHIDLAEAIATKKITSAGGFLEGLLRAAEDIRDDAKDDSSAVFRISDKLGLAVAKSSILDFVLDKWGKIIGGSALLPLAVRRVGKVVDLAKI
jgi:hypothetical protein